MTKSVITLKEKRRFAGELLTRLEAGKELAVEDRVLLHVVMGAGTAAMRARWSEIQERARVGSKAVDALEPTKKPYTEADVEAVGHKLDEIGAMLMALHEVATADLNGEWALDQMAEQFAKRGIRIIDACHEKLGQGVMGNFESEFKEEEEDEVESEPAEHS